jgi:signal transduction histidine kinase
MVEYKWEDCDFALSFEGFCQLGFSNIAPGIDTIIGRPFSHLVVNIDEQQVGDVVKRLCYIATMMTAKGTITANYEYHHGHLIISIEDTGKGITKELLPHVFERFIHDENNEMCGSGLDLPIVQTLVQQMGGKIDIESEKGKGTTVWVSIPCEAKTIERRRENNTNPSEATEL